MKKIDVQNAITNYISKNHLTIVDILNKRYRIESYEQYISCFSLIDTTYKNNIVEFSGEGKKFIDYINTFITNAIENSSEDDLENFINSNLLRDLKFNNSSREVHLISIYPRSILMQGECSKEAFINIYDELGYDKLKEYIQLVKSPSLFSSFINDANKQIVAMKFLLFKTNHHSPTKFKRNLTAKDLYELTNANVQESISAITKEKEDFIGYMNEQKENYNQWFSNTSNQIDDFREEHSKKLSDIEKTYEAKLKIEEPAKFMLEQSEKYKKSFYLWCCAIVGLTIFLIGLLALIVSPQVSFNDKLIIINVLSNDMPVYSSIILLAMISLVVYVLRIFIKMAVSSKHLMEEYKQKYSLTYFYLSLVHNGNIEDEKSQNIILTSLFTKADTGLIKNDGSNEIDKTSLSLLTK